MENSNSRILTYDLFRYQILTKSSFQFELFGDLIDAEELRRRKNIYFHEALLNIKNFISAHGKILHHKIYLDSDNIIAFKLGPDRTLRVQDRDFKEQTIETVEDVRVIIHNDPTIQKIAISKNKGAFGSSFVVANILETGINKQLAEFGLELSINPILKKENFWNLIKLHEDKITLLRFEIVRPNISNISNTLGDQLKEFVASTNSLKTTVEIKAPEGRALENINEENKQLKGIVEYATEGGASDIKLKINGVKRTIKTNGTIKSIEIGSLELEGNADKLKAVVKNVLGI